jgi:hypothetical protein
MFDYVPKGTRGLAHVDVFVLQPLNLPAVLCDRGQDQVAVSTIFLRARADGDMCLLDSAIEYVQSRVQAGDRLSQVGDRCR